MVGQTDCDFDRLVIEENTPCNRFMIKMYIIYMQLFCLPCTTTNDDGYDSSSACGFTRKYVYIPFPNILLRFIQS